MGYEVLLLCFSFTVPSTTRSTLLDDGCLGMKRTSNCRWIRRLDLFSLLRCPQVQWTIPTNSEHCNLGIVSNNSNCSSLSMSRIIFFDFSLNGFVGITLLQIGPEDLVDEGDSRSSSRVREHKKNSTCFTTACDNQTPWSRCLSPRAGGTVVHQRGRSVLTRSASSSCVFVFIQKFNRHIGTLAAKWEACVDFLSTRTGRLVCLNRSSCSVNWLG